MNKQEFIKAVAERRAMTQKATKEVLETMQEVVYEEMKNGGEVKIMDSITLMGAEVPERVCRNPQDGSEIVVPRHLTPKIKFGTAIKSHLRNIE